MFFHSFASLLETFRKRTNLRKYLSVVAAMTAMTAMTAVSGKCIPHLKPHETIELGQKNFGYPNAPSQ